MSRLSRRSAPALRRTIPVLAFGLGAFLLTTAQSCATKATLHFEPTTYFVGDSPGPLLVGDFNGDGRADLFRASAGPVLTVSSGDGDGSFLTALDTPVTDPTFRVDPRAAAAADFDGDGRLDVVLAGLSAAGQSNNLAIFIGDPLLNFRPGTAYAIPDAGAVATGVTVADVNGDGRADLAVTYTAPGLTTGQVEIWLGKGDGTFDAGARIPVGPFPFAITSGDFNGDGRKDLAVADDNSNFVYVLLGNGDGTFQASTASAAGPTLAIAVADLNHDSKPDLVVTTGGDTTSVSVLINNGNGTFADPRRYRVSEVPSSVAIADYDGDGELDVAIANRDGDVTVFLGNGDGTFQDGTSFSSDVDSLELATADFNGDGEPDLAVSSLNSGVVSALINTRSVDTDDSAESDAMVGPSAKLATRQF